MNKNNFIIFTNRNRNTFNKISLSIMLSNLIILHLIKDILHLHELFHSLN